MVPGARKIKLSAERLAPLALNGSSTKDFGLTPVLTLLDSLFKRSDVGNRDAFAHVADRHPQLEPDGASHFDADILADQLLNPASRQ